MFPTPRPGKESEVYNESYFDAYTERGILMPAETPQPPRRYLRRLLDVQRLNGVGTLLEVGPGSGAFLNYARNAGWRVVGIEASQYAAERIAARFGLDIHCGTLLSVDLPCNQFDVVHMSHVLEHLTEPAASLNVVNRILRPGGALIIEVPNEFESLQFRLLHITRLLRPYDVQSSHVFFFTPSTLRRLLEKSGFRVREISTVRALEGGSRVRRWLRGVAAAVERPFDVAPLIEVIAVK